MRAAQCLAQSPLCRPVSLALCPATFQFHASRVTFLQIAFPNFLHRKIWTPKYKAKNKEEGKQKNPETKVKEKQLQTSSAITPPPGSSFTRIHLQVDCLHPFPAHSPSSSLPLFLRWTMRQPFAVCFMRVYCSFLAKSKATGNNNSRKRSKKADTDTETNKRERSRDRAE